MARARPTPKCELRPQWAQRRVAETVTLDLPLPPAANNLFRNVPGKGRRKTERYRSWHAIALQVGNLQRPGRIVGVADVTIHLTAARGDSDAYNKALLDAAVAIGVIADDRPRYVRNVDLQRSNAEGPVRMVFVTARPGADAQTVTP